MYRVLLHLYPASWRAEYAAEMGAVFNARLRSARGFGVLALWISALLDTLHNAFLVHCDLLWQDVRYALRTFRRAPGFAVTAIGIAAVGIGATTAAFTMVDYSLIRPLPFPHQDRLVRLYADHGGEKYWDLSPGIYRGWKLSSTSFQSMGAYSGATMNLTGQGEPQTLDGSRVTGEVFSILGVQPVIGRAIAMEDDRESSPATVVLSYGLWQRVFGGDTGILGKTINMYDKPYTVIGVMPKTFYFPNRDAQFWVPMRWAPEDFQNLLDTYIYGIGLLKPGVSVEHALAELKTVAGRMAQEFPNELKTTSAQVLLVRDDIADQPKLMLKVLMGAALCVLLIACTNLANLLLARAMMRRRELAVRTALGAGRERLIRQALTESLMLSGAGGALGVLIAKAALPLLTRLVPVVLPVAEVPPIDGRVLFFAAVLTCLTGICFGAIPALRASRGNRALELHEGGRSGIGGRREHLRSVLVIAEVAMSIVLLAGFGLLAQALWRVQAIDPGFRADHVLTLRTSLPMPRYRTTEAREPFYSRVLAEVRQLPGVTSAAYATWLPMVPGFGGIWLVEAEGHPEDASHQKTASLRYVTPGYFATLGIPLRAGRDVEERDTNTSEYVALISESLARRYWGDQNPVGRHVNVGNNERRIIGVVGDVKFRGQERQNEPQVYCSWKQPNNVSPNYAPKDLAIRTSGDPMLLAPALYRIIHAADPSEPVINVRSLEDIVDAGTASRRVQLWVLGAFGAMAFLLAAVGIHGLLSFAVSTRTQEIGVRMALGAQRGDILAMTLWDGMRLSAIGLVLGVALAYGAGRLLQALLAGVKPDDVGAFGAAAALAVLMTLAGCALPAWRAVRIDPTTAIRTE
jgi:putative ABC transport system permease protein